MRGLRFGVTSSEDNSNLCLGVFGLGSASPSSCTGCPSLGIATSGLLDRGSSAPLGFDPCRPLFGFGSGTLLGFDPCRPLFGFGSGTLLGFGPCRPLFAFGFGTLLGFNNFGAIEGRMRFETAVEAVRPSSMDVATISELARNQPAYLGLSHPFHHPEGGANNNHECHPSLNPQP